LSFRPRFAALEIPLPAAVGFDARSGAQDDFLTRRLAKPGAVLTSEAKPGVLTSDRRERADILADERGLGEERIRGATVLVAEGRR